MNEPPQDIGPSRVQGCLFTAVGLFVVLLLALLVIAFLRFDEFTGEEEAPLSLQQAPGLVMEGIFTKVQPDRQPLVVPIS